MKAIEASAKASDTTRRDVDVDVSDSAAEGSLRAAFLQVFDHVRNCGLAFHAFEVTVMEHPVVVEHVTAHQLRDAVGIGREESNTNNLGHGLILERRDAPESDCGH